MSVDRIVQEALDKNPLGLKEAFADEIRSRIAVALAEITIVPDKHKIPAKAAIDLFARAHKQADNDRTRAIAKGHETKLNNAGYWEKDHKDSKRTADETVKHFVHKETGHTIKVHNQHGTKVTLSDHNGEHKTVKAAIAKRG